MEIKKDPTLLCDRDTNEQSCQVDPQDCQRQITNTYTLFYYPHIKAFPIFHREKNTKQDSHTRKIIISTKQKENFDIHKHVSTRIIMRPLSTNTHTNALLSRLNFLPERNKIERHPKKAKKGKNLAINPFW